MLTARRPDAGPADFCRRHRLVLIRMNSTSGTGTPGEPDADWINVRPVAAAEDVLTGLWWHPPGLAAAGGMALLLLGAIITHRKAADSVKEMAPALLAPLLTLAHLATALTG